MSEKYGLSETDISDVLSILQKNQKIYKISLFGSRAKGVFKDGSDVDLALMGVNLELNDILDASNEIEELLLPFKFDLIIYNRIEEKNLIEHIDRIGIVLFERD